MSTYKSRCKRCVHRKVCAYKEYYTEKEADGIDKCKHFKTDTHRVHLQRRQKNFS